jgi:hypothetical protein
MRETKNPPLFVWYSPAPPCSGKYAPKKIPSSEFEKKLGGHFKFRYGIELESGDFKPFPHQHSNGNDKIVICFMGKTLGYSAFAKELILQGRVFMYYAAKVTKNCPENSDYVIEIEKNGVIRYFNGAPIRSEASFLQHLPNDPEAPNKLNKHHLIGLCFKDMSVAKKVAFANAYLNYITSTELCEVRALRDISPGEIIGIDYGFSKLIKFVPVLFSRQGQVIDSSSVSHRFLFAQKAGLGVRFLNPCRNNQLKIIFSNSQENLEDALTNSPKAIERRTHIQKEILRKYKFLFDEKWGYSVEVDLFFRTGTLKQLESIQKTLPAALKEKSLLTHNDDNKRITLIVDLTDESEIKRNISLFAPFPDEKKKQMLANPLSFFKPKPIPEKANVEAKFVERCSEFKKICCGYVIRENIFWIQHTELQVVNAIRDKLLNIIGRSFEDQFKVGTLTKLIKKEGYPNQKGPTLYIYYASHHYNTLLSADQKSQEKKVLSA